MVIGIAGGRLTGAAVVVRRRYARWAAGRHRMAARTATRCVRCMRRVRHLHKTKTNVLFNNAHS